MKILRFQDNLSLGKTKVLTDSQSLIGDLNSSSKKYRLVAKIRATHSGYLLNNRVYPGAFMKDATETWVRPYRKPVLVNHNQHEGAPIGRVIGAEYHQLKHGEDFNRDYAKPSSGDDLGSGFIILNLSINDKDAIDRVMDGRYETVSTGHHTDRALCSICGNNWLTDSADSDSDGICEHRPGKKYTIEDKSRTCFLVGGKMTYDEVSYVNVPAQQNVKTLSINLEALENAITGKDSQVVFNSFEDGIVSQLRLVDSRGESMDLLLTPGKKDKLPDNYKQMKDAVVAFGDENMDTIFNNDDLTKTADKAVVEMIKEANVTQDEPVAKATDSVEQPVETVIVHEPEQTEPAVEQVAEAPVVVEPILSEEDMALYSVAKSIVDAGLLDEGTIDHEFSVDMIKDLATSFDAKLTTEQRKKLRASTFCGPDRSFPVPDCAHVTAARRLIGRAKLSEEQKKRVLSCVSRKAKSLSCDNAECQIMENEPVVKAPSVDSKVNADAVKAQDIILNLSKEKDSLTEQVKRLQSSLDAKISLCDEITKENTKLKADLIKETARQLAISRINLGKPGTIGINSKDKLDTYVEELSKRSLDSLRDSLADILPELDMLMRKGGAHTSLFRETKVEDPSKGKKDQTNVTRNAMDGRNEPNLKNKEDFLNDI